MSKSGSNQGKVPALPDAVRSIHLVRPLVSGAAPLATVKATTRLGSCNVIEFPGAESKLAPQLVADGSVTTLALAAIAPLALWLGHALLVSLHLL